MFYMEQPSVAQQVLDYLKRKPYVHEAIEQGIINYSALARQVAQEMGIKNVETVKAALIRHSKKIRKEKKKQGKEDYPTAATSKLFHQKQNSINTFLLTH